MFGSDDRRRHLLGDALKKVTSAADALTEAMALVTAFQSANADVHIHERRRVQASGTVEVAFKVVMPTAPGAAEATGTFTSVRNDLAAAASAIAHRGRGVGVRHASLRVALGVIQNGGGG